MNEFNPFDDFPSESPIHNPNLISWDEFIDLFPNGKTPEEVEKRIEEFRTYGAPIPPTGESVNWIDLCVWLVHRNTTRKK